MLAGHACPPQGGKTRKLGHWLNRVRSSYKRGVFAAGKVAALRAVGVKFDLKRSRAIREQHEGTASGKGKEAEEETGPGKNFEDKLQELKEYKRRHGEGVHVVLCAGCCSLAGDEGAPGLIASWCTRAGRPRLPSGSSSDA